jgi:hypothetical protein
MQKLQRNVTIFAFLTYVLRAQVNISLIFFHNVYEQWKSFDDFSA